MSATAMPVVPAEPVEEIYMIMNSATLPSSMLSTHHNVMLNRMDLHACRDNNKKFRINEITTLYNINVVVL